MESELLALPEHLGSPPVFCVVRVAQSLDFLQCFVDNKRERTMQKNWQYSVYKTKKKKQITTTQYVLDTIIRKQTQIP